MCSRLSDHHNGMHVSPPDPRFTSTGLFFCAVLPMPSWPLLFAPQHFRLTVPPDTSAHVCPFPVAMEMAKTPDGGWVSCW